MNDLIIDQTQLYPTASKSILAGEDAYQLIIMNIAGVCSMVTDGLITDWNTMPNVDFSKPYWNKEAMDVLSIAGHTPYAVGDFIITDPSSIMYNKALLEALALDAPYGLVNDGKWSWDKLTEIASTASADIDGDGEYTNADQYGFVAQLDYEFAGILHSCGQHVIEKDSDGVPRIVLNNEKTVKATLHNSHFR